MKYYWIKWTGKLTKGFGGTAQGPFIKMLEKYKGDSGLIEHEKVHVRQWYIVLGFGLLLSAMLTLLLSLSLWPLLGLAPFLHQQLYKVIRPYRARCEVQAYRRQIEVGGYISNEFAVRMLVEKYDLGLSEKEVRTLLFN